LPRISQIAKAKAVVRTVITFFRSGPQPLP
jgi:hypothetical protein